MAVTLGTQLLGRPTFPSPITSRLAVVVAVVTPRRNSDRGWDPSPPLPSIRLVSRLAGRVRAAGRGAGRPPTGRYPPAWGPAGGGWPRTGQWCNPVHSSLQYADCRRPAATRHGKCALWDGPFQGQGRSSRKSSLQSVSRSPSAFTVSQSLPQRLWRGGTPHGSQQPPTPLPLCCSYHRVRGCQPAPPSSPVSLPPTHPSLALCPLCRRRCPLSRALPAPPPPPHPPASWANQPTATMVVATYH